MPRVNGRPYAIGALAGLLATLAHTAVMVAGHAFSPRARDEPTPPRQITATAARRALPDASLTMPRVTIATTVLHFGYGALAGALHPVFVERLAERPIARGVRYGMGVWAASYCGWLPAFRFPPPATRQPPQQNATMILAHVAWGAALGATVGWADRRHSRPTREDGYRLASA